MKLKLLTPLWTGDIEGSSEKLRETGLIGSLRWWFSVLANGEARNQGYNRSIVCDSKSGFNQVEYFKQRRKNKDIVSAFPELEAQLHGLNCSCPTCVIFGTSGLSRKFSIQVKNIEARKPIIPKYGEFFFKKQSIFSAEEYSEINAIHPNNSDNEIELDFVCYDRRFQQYIESVFAYILTKVSNFGLGAKTQNGFGAFSVIEEAYEEKIKQGKIYFEELIKESIKIQSNKELHKINYLKLPEYDKMFSILYEIISDNPLCNSTEDQKTFCGMYIRQKILRKKLRPNKIIEFLNDTSTDINEEKKDIIINCLFGCCDNTNDKDSNTEANSDTYVHLGNISASQIHVSNAYYEKDSWYFKIWGWTVNDILQQNGLEINPKTFEQNFLTPQVQKINQKYEVKLNRYLKEV